MDYYPGYDLPYTNGYHGYDGYTGYHGNYGWNKGLNNGPWDASDYYGPNYGPPRRYGYGNYNRYNRYGRRYGYYGGNKGWNNGWRRGSWGRRKYNY
ncbi:Hypothetical predicted protein [Mytilus galloprovincialis]|uniref:Uncharacterized protein n=1 Tax=Mytilus galloprovincialis TaxID=29158 RepID=A0A8B6CI67_MYTGA|nr:Hypothetical predicted protein [Mytilus galloprovincialis]